MSPPRCLDGVNVRVLQILQDLLGCRLLGLLLLRVRVRLCCALLVLPIVELQGVSAPCGLDRRVLRGEKKLSRDAPLLLELVGRLGVNLGLDLPVATAARDVDDVVDVNADLLLRDGGLDVHDVAAVLRVPVRHEEAPVAQDLGDTAKDRIIILHCNAEIGLVLPIRTLRRLADLCSDLDDVAHLDVLWLLVLERLSLSPKADCSFSEALGFKFSFCS